MENVEEARENSDASHGFSAKLYPLGKDMLNEDMLLTLKLKIQHDEASFHFLINRGSTRSYECFKIKEDFQKFEFDSDINLSMHDMDAILLCGADVRQAGDIIRFLLNYPHLQVICTEAVAISLKLYLYDAIFLKEAESCLIVCSKEEATQEDQVDQAMGHLEQETCYFTVEDIDKALNQIKRVRFYEIFTFVKKIQQGQGQNAQTISLAVQAVPSGISLGSCAWYFCGEGEYASALVSDHLTLKGTWLFDGFEPTCLIRPPSLFISTCRFNTKLDSPSDSTTPGGVDLPQLPQDVGSKIINFTKRILSHGGSVVIPVDINFDAIRLLALFQSSWTVFWKTYPIYFVSPTADLLVSFARAMLCWVSRKLRTDFSDTRHNPLAHFPSIRFVSYAQECLLDSSVPRVLICTPFHLSSGSLFSLDAWLSVCENPNSAILFLKPPSPRDMLYLKHKTSLNVKRFVPYSSMMASPLFHDSTKQPIHVHSSQNSDAHVDHVKKSHLTASFSTELLHQDILEAQPDDYGLPLTTEEEDDWADLRLPTCQHARDGSCSLPTNSHEQDTESFTFHTSSHVDEAHFKSHFNSSPQSRVSLWGTMLETLQRAKKNMSGHTPRTSRLDIQALQHTILGFYNEPSHLDIQTTEHFMEWLLPIILIEPSHVIILPRIVTPRVLSFLFSTCLQNTFPRVPSLYICAPQQKTSFRQNASLMNLPDTPTEPQWCGFSQVCMVWNELFIDLQDPYVAEFLKQHQTMLHGSKDHEILKESQPNSCLSLTYRDKQRSQSWGIHHNDPIMSLAYIPLKIHQTTITSANVSYGPNSSVGNQNNLGDINMMTGKTKNNLEQDKGTGALTHLSALCGPTKIPSHLISEATNIITHPTWVHIGHVTQSAMLDLLRHEFSKEWISTSPRCILLNDFLSIDFSHHDNGHQTIHLCGGWDMGTLRTKQRLMSVLRGIGSFLKKTYGSSREFHKSHMSRNEFKLTHFIKRCLKTSMCRAICAVTDSNRLLSMKASRKIGVNRRRINPKDSRVVKKPSDTKETKKKKKEEPLREVVKPSLGMFFNYNNNLAPPYQVIVDTNFINFSIQHKLDILQEMMNCLLAKCIPYVTDCVIGELEKMGHRFRLALKLARDPRFKRLKCLHSGTYADDCLVQRVTEHKCYIVATNDKDLKRRIRKIPGVPIMFVTNRKYAIERMPDALSNVPLGKGPSN